MFCNIKLNVPGLELPAPSGTQGRGQLQVRRSSRVQEGWDEPGLSLLSVPGKAAVQPGKLREDSFLSLCCCCAGHYLKTGGEGEERKRLCILGI